MTPRRLFFIITIIALVSILLQGGDLQVSQASTTVILEGTFITIWGDGLTIEGEDPVRYYLFNNQGEEIRLNITDEELSSLGGILLLNGQPVIVQGNWLLRGASLEVQSIMLREESQAKPDGIYGPQPWVSILCKFADVSAEPENLDYFQEMYSADYPGLDHYWQQQSYGLANLEGSGAFGWFVLPHPRSYYLPGGDLDWWTAAQECTAVADEYVDFTQYVGINLMFNDLLDCCAWGGGWYACLDGLCQTWRTTWEPPWGYQNIGVIAHETGHGFGLPHSLGNCQQGYDNRWDVLSDVWSNGDDPIFGNMGQHTISYHKEMLGWFEAQQTNTVPLGTIKTITLERLALPQTGNTLEARIPINGLENYFYTVEVRQPTNELTNYDKWLPGFAVIIHEVATNRGEPAIVIDKDGNCNTGDAGAMYTPGEVFEDLPHGIKVSIESTTETGYVVTINNRFTLMEEVNLQGTSQAYVEDSVPYTATVTPVDATTPITYTWEATGLPPVVQVGGHVDMIDLTWEEPGTKVITVTATNAGGSVIDTHLVEIAQKIPVVELSGPSESKVGEMNTFTASVSPMDVLQPITYTWQASGLETITHTAGLSDSVAFTWMDPGTQVITVTANNRFGSTIDSYSLPVYMPPTSVEVSGVAMGDVNREYSFTATVDPITTTVPITYTWEVDGQPFYSHVGGVSDTAIISWDKPGLHHLWVSATNAAGNVVDTWSITLYVKIYLPISQRN